MKASGLLAAFTTRPWLWKTAAITYAVYMGGIIAVYMFVAGRGVSYSYTVAGQKSVAIGAPTALRVGVYDIYGGRFLPGTKVDVALVRGQKSTRVYTGQTSPDGFADVNVVLDEQEPGDASWRITLEPRRLDPETVDIPITLVALSPPDATEPWSEAASTVTPKPNKDADKGEDSATDADTSDAGGVDADKDADTNEAVESDEREIELQMTAEGHEAADGLRSVFFVLATDKTTGEPLATTIDVKLEKGMVDGSAPEKLETGPDGLAAFAVTPIGQQQWHLTAEAKNGPGRGVASLVGESEPKQYAVVLKHPVWRAGEEYEIGVRTLHTSGAVYADVYLDNHWQHGEVSGVGRHGGGFAFADGSIARPSEGVWLASIQSYGLSLQPGDAIDSRYVAVPAPGTDDRQVLKILLQRAANAGVLEKTARALSNSDWITKAKPRELAAQISFWLSQLEGRPQQPHLLLDTQEGERTRLADEKESFRGTITTLLIVSGSLGLALILYLVVFNLVVVRRESEVMVAELLDGEDLPETDADTGEQLANAANLARMQSIVQLIFLFGTIALFFVAVVVLLQHL